MSTVEPAHEPHHSLPEVRTIGLDEPWRWLADGWRDLWRRPAISLGYGLAITLISWILTAGLLSMHMASMSIVLAGGFLLLGPLLAVGLYELSRRLQTGEPIAARDIILVSTRKPVQLAFLGVGLMLAYLAWLRIAMLLFALFFGTEPFPPLEQFLPTLLFTWKGLSLLVVGTIAGAIIAFAVFALTAISVPMLMVRETDAFTAIATSIKAIAVNFRAMLLWAWLIAVLIGCGLVTGYLGLIVTFPLIGHATWHAYHTLVESSVESS